MAMKERNILTVRIERGIQMPVLVRTLKKTAKVELERAIREIEEKAKKAQSTESLKTAEAATRSNLEFAQRLNLISFEEGNDYRERIQRAGVVQQEQMITDLRNQENSGKQIRANDVQAMIAKERATEAAKRKQAEQGHSKDESELGRSK